MIKFASYFLFLILCFALSSNKTDKDSSEYEVKAAFIINFTKFVEWENIETKSVFSIGLPHETPVFDYLNEYTKNKNIQQKKGKIEYMYGNTLKDEYQIVFIPYTTNKTIVNKILSSQENCLIITEKNGALQHGSCINFITKQNKVKFEINLANIKKNNLKISSQLLKLAEKVIE